ncbi:MAG: hypothetical protein KGZ40_04600 [Clostridiales bacterium]|nr:hypothetical protein [Clostridiales bacterium]
MTEMNESPNSRSSAKRRSRAKSGGSVTDVASGPTGAQLFKSVAISIVVAVAILILFVLPVEYGIDITGAGDALGLTRSAEADGHALSGEEDVTPAAIVSQTDLAKRADSMSVTLQPGEGAEVKVRMSEGESIVFEWISEGGPVNFDMHGEGAAVATTSYWAGAATESGAGTFVAPIDGTHGWFWRNRGEGPVEVTVSTAGFYEELFRAE